MRKKKDDSDEIIVVEKTSSRESVILTSDEKAAVVEETEKIAVKKVSNTFDNPGGCLWAKPGCPATKIRIVWSRKTPFFFCECGYDTPSPSKEIYELAEAFGLLQKE